MKIVCISDTHGVPANEITIPTCDVVIHAGDSTTRSNISEAYSFIDSYKQLLDGTAQHFVFVPGNHGRIYENREQLAELKSYISMIPRFHILINDSIEIEGVKFWGSPVTPPFCDWAFNWENSARETLWSSIPDDTDVVITHGPPAGTLDVVKGREPAEHLGCQYLARRIEELAPKLHVFGHIHSGHGEVMKNGTRYVNASIMNERYRPSYSPIEVELEKK